MKIITWFRGMNSKELSKEWYLEHMNHGISCLIVKALKVIWSQWILRVLLLSSCCNKTCQISPPLMMIDYIFYYYFDFKHK